MRTTLKTYATSAVTHERTRIFQRTDNAEKMVELLFHYRDTGRYLLHGYVVMPDHIHVLLTPQVDQTIERCMQCIKGGFSFAIREDFKSEVWQRGFHEHRIRDLDDFINQRHYIAMNPSRKNWDSYEYVHTHQLERLDEAPEYLRG